MLAVTPAAEAAITTLLDDPDLPEHAGVRLQRGLDASGQAAIGIAIIDAPGPDDESIPDADQAELFLAPDVAAMLDDQVLDAQIEDRNVAFTIRPQSVDGQPPQP